MAQPESCKFDVQDGGVCGASVASQSRLEREARSGEAVDLVAVLLPEQFLLIMLGIYCTSLNPDIHCLLKLGRTPRYGSLTFIS